MQKVPRIGTPVIRSRSPVIYRIGRDSFGATLRGELNLRNRISQFDPLDDRDITWVDDLDADLASL